MAKFKRGDLVLTDNEKLRMGSEYINEIKTAIDSTSTHAIVTESVFSPDINLSDNSNALVPTQRAVRTFFKNRVFSGVNNLPIDSSAVSVIFTVPTLHDNYAVSCILENGDDLLPSMYNKIIRDKTVDGFSILFSDYMDSANYILNWTVILSDGFGGTVTELFGDNPLHTVIVPGSSCVAWSDSDYNGYFLLKDNTGTTTAGPFLFSSNARGKVSALVLDDQVILAYEVSDSIMAVRFSKTGEQLISPINIGYSYGVSSNVKDVKVLELSDGSIIFAFVNNYEDLEFDRYNPTFITASNIIGYRINAVGAGVINLNATVLNNGAIAAAYTRNDGYLRNVLIENPIIPSYDVDSYEIGNISSSEDVLDRFDIKELSTGYVVLHAELDDAMEYYDIHITKFDNSGNITASKIITNANLSVNSDITVQPLTGGGIVVIAGDYLQDAYYHWYFSDSLNLLQNKSKDVDGYLEPADGGLSSVESKTGIVSYVAGYDSAGPYGEEQSSSNNVRFVTIERID